jgi:transposase
MGKKNWLFRWTELGAKLVAIVQSLLVTCKLHDIDPYDYLVDMLQRVGQHPASKFHELTPRRWKELFANNPLRSDLHNIENRRNNAA